ncbi:MAG: ferritin-like domain-containing protein [Akkermansiaceae bacterium]|nr:ferritin-like domain-containing protein [Armatimonadota bacterium]
MPKPLQPFTFADSLFGTGDVKVLNYALALEATEADLYRQALIRLTTGGTINGVNVAGLGLTASQPDVDYVSRFGRVEREHRDFLIAGITQAGATPITSGALSGATFDFGIGSLDRRGVVDLLRVVEATGTEAYLGAIPFFSTKTYLAVAGGIQATEARHTAVITAVQNSLFGSSFATAPLVNQNNGIDRIDQTPDIILGIVSGPNGFIVLP